MGKDLVAKNLVGREDRGDEVCSQMPLDHVLEGQRFTREHFFSGGGACCEFRFAWPQPHFSVGQRASTELAFETFNVHSSVVASFDSFYVSEW